MQTALNFLSELDTSSLQEGKIEIDGDKVFAFAQRYDTKPEEETHYEAHRKYIDMQYMISGSERMGWTPIDQLNITEEYDEENDFLLGTPNAESTQAPFHAGQIMILHPSDAHAPGINLNGESKEVRKLVLKVALD